MRVRITYGGGKLTTREEGLQQGGYNENPKVIMRDGSSSCKSELIILSYICFEYKNVIITAKG